jgi:hypothetical protein
VIIVFNSDAGNARSRYDAEPGQVATQGALSAA